MNQSRSTGWPAFELATLKVGPDLPAGAQVLATRGVPRRIVGHEFTALPQARLVAADAGSELVAFGSSGLRGLVCLDLGDDSIVHLPNPEGPQRNPVNTNLDRFIQCAAAVIKRFPFYDEDDEPDLWETVADELASTLEQIDGATALHNSFWVTFLDDVRIGDFMTTMIVDS